MARSRNTFAQDSPSGGDCIKQSPGSSNTNLLGHIFPRWYQPAHNACFGQYFFECLGRWNPWIWLWICTHLLSRIFAFPMVSGLVFHYRCLFNGVAPLEMWLAWCENCEQIFMSLDVKRRNRQNWQWCKSSKIHTQCLRNMIYSGSDWMINYAVLIALVVICFSVFLFSFLFLSFWSFSFSTLFKLRWLLCLRYPTLYIF